MAEDNDDDEHESLVVLLEFSVCFFQHIQSSYLNYDEEMLEDVMDIIETILQCIVALLGAPDNVTVNELFTCLQLVAAVKADYELRKRRCRGRPGVYVGDDQLRYLVENGFKTKDISELYGCSRRTIERRMNEYSIHREYSSLSDSELDSAVQEIVRIFPNCGEKTISGRLKSFGCNVQKR